MGAGTGAADRDGATRVGRIEVSGAASARRPSGWRARSPTRRSSRPRSTAATRTGAGSRRRPGWRSPARSCRARPGPDRRRASWDPRAGGRDAGAAGRGDGGARLLLRPHPGLRRAERGVHDMSRPARRQRRDPARGAALHPRVPRAHGGDQVRRRGDARGGAARGLRHRRRPAQVRRAEPGDRPRRRPGHHQLHGAAGDGGAVPRGRARLRPRDGRGGEDGPARQGQLRHRQPAQPPRPAGGRALGRGRDAVRDPPARERRRRSGSSARSSGSTSTSSTTSPRTTSR